MATYFRLIYRIQRDRGAGEARTYLLPAGRTLIGCASTCTIMLDDRTVSEQHAQIDYDADNNLYRLTDLNSDNGTRLRGGRLPPETPIPLRPNAIFQIGSYEFVFEEQQAWDTPAGQDARAEQTGELHFDLYEGEVPPGCARYSLRLLHYLPEIYHPMFTAVAEAAWSAEADTPTTFLSRFLALFESVLLPLESMITNFDFYLDARTAPFEFLPWLEHWYGLPLGENLSEEQRRQALLAAHRVFELKGTATALKEVITLCTGIQPEIDEGGVDAPGAQFTVTLNATSMPVDQVLVEHLINAFKPVHTTYTLQIG